MKRVIKFERNKIFNVSEKKFILQKEYNGFGIYQEMCHNGFYISQSWYITNDKVGLVCDTYNNFCEEELLDFIDNYNENGKFGVAGFLKATNNDAVVFLAHSNYKTIV